VNFSELLRRIDAIDGDYRLRFMTSHPKDATHELFDTIAGEPAHLPPHPPAVPVRQQPRV
jgi:tRNA-2-methylthio-N6-dimethylallyladenosine synthase